MSALNINQTLILNKNLPLPSHGIICAHPGRVKRIAEVHFEGAELHTDYRGFQVYTGLYGGRPVFAANTGIGAPAAAFIIEELVCFGAKRILRLGSNDAMFEKFKLNIVEQTTLPTGLCEDYRYYGTTPLTISKNLKRIVSQLAESFQLPINFTFNRHIDGYFPVNFSHCLVLDSTQRFTSQDMETGALYLLAEVRKFECLSALISYPKHETQGEYCDNGQTAKFEGLAIDFALNLLIGE